MSQWAEWFGLIAGGLLVLAWALRYAIRRSLAPARLLPARTPADFALDFRDLRLPTANGKTLQAWQIPAAGKAVGAAVLLHGWGGNRDNLLPLAAALHRAGWACLLFDARCHGASDEDSFTSLPRFAEDLAHACTAMDGDGPLVVIGHSVGAAAALLHAARTPAVAAVVSIAAFSHPAHMMRRWLAQKGVPYFPLGWLILRYVQAVIGARFDDIAPRRSIQQLRGECLLIHGAEDEIVPVHEAREIFAAGDPARTQLQILSGRHDDFGHSEAQGIAQVCAFLQTLLTRQGVPAKSP
ncbi:MAG: alpha/beta fold hydrolase [Rhodocyclales bacterium]|nr:alpha/beta fold hydrolase [Rhodocyclales bacterium]